MTTQFARNWRVFFLRGLAAVVFSVLAFLTPFTVPTMLAVSFGAYALVDGFLTAYASVNHRRDRYLWLFLLLEGLVGVAAGLLTFSFPGVNFQVLFWFIAGWAILTGILEIAEAARLRSQLEGEWMLVSSGFLSLLFGLLALVFPFMGLLAVAWLIAFYAVLFGFLLITLSLRAWGWGSPNDRVAPRVA